MDRVSFTGLRHCGALVARQEVETHPCSKWDVAVQTFGPGDVDGKQFRILN